MGLLGFFRLFLDCGFYLEDKRESVNGFKQGVNKSIILLKENGRPLSQEDLVITVKVDGSLDQNSVIRDRKKRVDLRDLRERIEILSAWMFVVRDREEKSSTMTLGFRFEALVGWKSCS